MGCIIPHFTPMSTIKVKKVANIPKNVVKVQLIPFIDDLLKKRLDIWELIPIITK
jgi:hypothetical protein